MILIIDNYDSFVYNLAQYVGELGGEPLVIRNDQIGLADIARLAPSHLILSPGPCTPLEAGITNEAIARFGGEFPILGVCLGHQAIGHVYGGQVVRAPVPRHGKPSPIHHDGQTIFAGLPNPFPAGRYHSLVVALESIPPCLGVSARTEDGVVMGLRHRSFVVEGVQFHPESIMTPAGHDILRRFLAYRDATWRRPWRS